MDYSSLAEELLEQLIKNAKLDYLKDAEDFSQGEMRILSYLYYESDGVCSGKLCKSIGMTTPRLSAALAALEKKGFIKRLTDEGDRRRVHVHVTDKGRFLVKEKREKALSHVRGILESLGESDAKEYIRIIERITDLCRV